ncbi:MAG: bifunctional 3-(3-hydroxy-phenyl)propionate/3-hydroxycinnamic acid hydroxylase [Streptosporangiaceae bacterium]
MRPRPDPVDVLVVGFGPVGAVLAGLLGKLGLDVLVLERDYQVFPLPRAAHVDHTGLRTWQELDLLDRLLPAMQANLGLDFLTAGGDLLARIPGDQSSSSGLPTSMYFFQPVLDSAVREAVTAMPSVSVRLGAEVTGLTSADDYVEVTAAGPDGEPLEVMAKWVVACDGAGSRIRDQIGFDVEDLHFEEPWLVVDLVLDGERAEPGRAICLCDPRRPTYSIPMPARRHRFEFRLMDGDDPATTLQPGRISELVANWFPGRPFELERTAIYTFHGLVARNWRHQRVFLAGDAAHQMPPFLGQGMCSGLRDAANLAWKLDLVLRGGAPDDLLNTYTEERRAHVRSVAESAVRIGRLICTIDTDEAAERDRRMLSESRPPSQRIAFTLPALRVGSLIRENGGDLFVQPAGPDGRLDDVIGSRFAVLARTPALIGPGPADWWRDRMGAFTAAAGQLAPAHAKGVLAWLDSHDSDVVVVRPDRYVLWAGPDLDDLTRKIAGLLAG